MVLVRLWLSLVNMVVGSSDDNLLQTEAVSLNLGFLYILLSTEDRSLTSSCCMQITVNGWLGLELALRLPIRKAHILLISSSVALLGQNPCHMGGSYVPETGTSDVPR